VKIIAAGDGRVAAIIRKKTVPDMRYRLSAFTYLFSADRAVLAHNTLTGATAVLTEEEWALMQQTAKQPATGALLQDRGLAELTEYGFLTAENTDDYEQYRKAVTVLRLMSREMAGTKTYTILPTTACNARCVYCYEEGMPVCSMNAETADRTAEFIRKTRWEDKIKLVWFGGEPLVGSRIISRICGRLTEMNVPFRSKIVTNATLMTPELLAEAISVWRLESAQVSVDGEKAAYAARKRYADPAAHHYDGMMDAVERMLDAGIRVTLRCKYDADNLDGLKTYIDDVKARFGGRENLAFYPAMLFQAKDKENGIETYRKAQAVAAYAEECGLKGRTEKAFRLKLNLCGADSGDKSVVIAPDGRLYHCEHLPGNTSFGSIFDPETAVCSDKRADLPAGTQCRTCCFLPQCTPFYRNGCPDCFGDCRMYRQIETEEMLRHLIRS